MFNFKYFLVILILYYNINIIQNECIENKYINHLYINYPIENDIVNENFYLNLNLDLKVKFNEYRKDNQHYLLCIRSYLLSNTSNIATNIYDHCIIPGEDSLKVIGKVGWNLLVLSLSHNGIELCNEQVIYQCCNHINNINESFINDIKENQHNNITNQSIYHKFFRTYEELFSNCTNDMNDKELNVFNISMYYQDIFNNIFHHNQKKSNSIDQRY